jgi:hypothetical protein
VCGDILIKDQCEGDDVPSSLEDACFFLKGNDSESSSQKQNKCVLKVCNERR